MLDTYLNFVINRHRIWERRGTGEPQETWTDDPILATKKFTNVYRVLDFQSQFLVQELLGMAGTYDKPSPRDVFFRCFLFRYTNRHEPWVAWANEFGDYPTWDDAFLGTLTEFWSDYRAAGNPIFGNAYKMFVGSENAGMSRMEWAVDLAVKATREVFTPFAQAASLAERLDILQTMPRCAGFMAMQIATDWGYYDPTFSENSAVILGPGARRGAQEIYPGLRPEATFREVHKALLEHPDCPSLAGRPPSLMDSQNCMCEFSKYARYSRQQPAIPSLYKPKHLNQDLYLPPHWEDEQPYAREPHIG